MKKLIVLAFSVLVGSLVAFSNVAHAAGTLTMSLEPTSATWNTSTTNAISIYGTTSGANTSGFSFTVNLTNMTIDHFDSSGNPFDLDSVSSGGSAGSTSVTITTGYSSLAGGSGKQLVGKLYVTTKSTAGTGTAAITSGSIDAYDANLAPMAGVGTSRSYTISAPVAPSPTPTPTPTPTPAPKPSTSNPKTTVTVPKPSTTSTAVVPTETTQPKAEAVTTTVPETTTTTPVTKPDENIKKPKSNAVAYGIGVSAAILLLVALMTKPLMRRLHDRKMHAHHFQNSLNSEAVIGGAPVVPPTQPTTPTQVVTPTNPEQKIDIKDD